jgi:5-formyltetrahydrofolate cyclo-ligase
VDRKDTSVHPRLLKKKLRDCIKDKLLHLSPEFKEQASRIICNHLMNFFSRLDAFPTAVVGFFHLEDEPDLRPFFQALAETFPSVKLGFPRVEGETLTFYVPSSIPGKPDESEWVEGPFGIREPRSHLPRFGAEIPWGNRPLVLVPGRVFDYRGGRIGRGKGYYDRFLHELRAKEKNPLSLGVCFSLQIVDTVPLEPGDELMDCIITEQGTYFRSS